MTTGAATVILAIGGLGIVVLLVAIKLTNGRRRIRRQLGSLRGVVGEVEQELRTPRERAERDRRIEEIEAHKREIHGRFNADGT